MHKSEEFEIQGLYGSILALKILDEVHKNAKQDEYEE